jgi:type II secretory pathway component PulM
MCTILCAVVLFAACSEPPQREINGAQAAIDAARAAGAEQ